MRFLGIRAVGLLMVIALLLAPMGACAEGQVEPPRVPVTKIQFTKTSGSLNVFVPFDLNTLIKITPSAATNRGITWTSGDETILSVTDEGVVTALRDGTASICATSKDNPLASATIKIKAVAVRVKSVKLDQARTIANSGEQFTVRATVSPANASFPAITWASDNASVAVVDEHGQVTAVGPGRAAITCASDLGRATAKMYAYVRGGDMKVIKISSMGDTVLGGDKKIVKKADKPIGDGLTSWLRFQKFYNAYGASYFTAGVRDVLANDDLSIVNFEGTITAEAKTVNKTFAFKGKPEYVNVLTAGSIEVATLANNHSQDYLPRGYSDTKKYLKRAGVTAIGFNGSGVATRTVNGVKIGFAGFNIPVSKGTISSTINLLKKSKKCSIVIVQFHWSHSKEWTNKISSKEQSLARYAVTKGADLVVGHHKHQVSGIERYKDKMIAYDVGNFIAMIRNSIDGKLLDKAAMIYQQKFNVFEDGYVEVLDPNIVPIMVSDSQEVLTGNPHVSTGAEAERVLGLVRMYSPATSAHLVRYDSGY